MFLINNYFYPDLHNILACFMMFSNGNEICTRIPRQCSNYCTISSQISRHYVSLMMAWMLGRNQ